MCSWYVQDRKYVYTVVRNTNYFDLKLPLLLLFITQLTAWKNALKFSPHLLKLASIVWSVKYQVSIHLVYVKSTNISTYWKTLKCMEHVSNVKLMKVKFGFKVKQPRNQVIQEFKVVRLWEVYTETAKLICWQTN